MERSLGATFFLIASVALGIAFGSWWLHRVAFSPSVARDPAYAILKEPDIRQELIGLIAPLAAPKLATNASDLGGFLETRVLTKREGGAVMATILEHAHEIIIGDTDEPLLVSGSELVPIVRDERAAEVAEFTIPLEKIGTLSTFKTATTWMTLGGATLALIMVALGIVTRPERREMVNGIGELLLALAVGVALFGYAVPVHLFTALDDRTWTRAIPQLALRSVPVVIGTTAVLALGGAFLIIASKSGGGGGRKQWSTPLSTVRYQGGDNPGWR